MTNLIIRTNNQQTGAPKFIFTTVYERYTTTGDLIDVQFSNCESYTADMADASFRQSFSQEIEHGLIRVISTAVAVGGFQSDEDGGIVI
jgi:hypothetical protein